MSDAPRVSSYERALLWARLGDVWWRGDQPRARAWLLKAVELVEAQPDEKSAVSCRLVTSRALLGIIALRDKGLNERLMSIIGANRDNQDADQRRENATALAETALSLVANDPEGAEKLGEKSLSLGVSMRLASLLWRLRARDQAAADKLFMQALQAATATSDFNCFSMLVTAAFQGPFSSEGERRVVLSALAETVSRPRPSPSDEAVICHLAFFLPSLVTYFDTLLPEQSQRIRATIALCQRSHLQESDKSGDKSSDNKTPVTIDELLKAASETTNQTDRDRYLLQAVRRAAEKKDFERAIDILDSIDDGQMRLGDSWESLRWYYASSLACAYRKNDNLSAMMKILEATPPNLRAFARISFATTCQPATGSAEVMELLEAGRKELTKAAIAQQPIWYLGLVRLYAKLSPDTTPAVLNEAVAAINRASKGEAEECSADEGVRRVLTNQLLLDQYKLPLSLLEADEAGVRYAVGSIQPGDKRVAVRLELLRSVLEKQRSTADKPKVQTGMRQ